MHINLVNLHEDRFQSIQDFRDQYIEMKKVFDVTTFWQMQKRREGSHQEKECEKPNISATKEGNR